MSNIRMNVRQYHCTYINLVITICFYQICDNHSSKQRNMCMPNHPNLNSKVFSYMPSIRYWFKEIKDWQ